MAYLGLSALNEKVKAFSSTCAEASPEDVSNVMAQLRNSDGFVLDANNPDLPEDFAVAYQDNLHAVQNAAPSPMHP